MCYFKIVVVFLFAFVTSCKKNPGVSETTKATSNDTLGLINELGFGEGRMLTISKKENIGMPKVQLSPDSIYSSYSLEDPLFTPMPAGYEDQVISFRLPKGYMAVFAENSDGTGESVCYVAVDSTINADLPARLRNNISYIRYIRINNPDKKGTGSTQDAAVLASGSQWFYGWSLNRSSFPGQQFVPMTWGKYTCNDNNVKYLVERPDVDHLLSFNEPDNTNQSNIPNIDTAVARYKIMQKTGLRLGTPVTTQDQAIGDGRWLTRFMAKAQQEKLRIDFIPVHWYDWGNQFNNKATDSLTAEAIFNRFTNYMQKVHAAYPGVPIWVTEFNANVNRSSAVIHEYFMKLATDWMNSTPYVERYAYFFPKTLPDVNSDFSLTEAGEYWKSLISTKSFNGNIVSNDTILNVN